VLQGRRDDPPRGLDKARSRRRECSSRWWVSLKLTHHPRACRNHYRCRRRSTLGTTIRSTNLSVAPNLPSNLNLRSSSDQISVDPSGTLGSIVVTRGPAPRARAEPGISERLARRGAASDMITRPGGQRSCPRGRPSSRSRTARPSCLQDDAPSSWRAAWPCCGVMLRAWSKGTRVTVIPSSSASFGAISGPACRRLGQGNGASERAASEQVEPERAHPGAVVVGLPPSWR